MDKAKKPATARKLTHKAKQIVVTAKKNEAEVELKEKASDSPKKAVTANKLTHKAKQIVVTAKKNQEEVELKEEEDARRKLVVIAQKLAEVAKEKEDVRKKLEVTAEELATTAKDKESIRSKLAVAAKEKEDVRLKLATTAKELKAKAEALAETAKEKEDVRKKMVVTAEELATTAKDKESIRRKLVVTAKEKEDVRKKLEVTAEELATTAKDKESIRKKLEVTAEELKLKAKNLAVVAEEKESIRLKLEWETAKLTASIEALRKGYVMLDTESNVLLTNSNVATLFGEPAVVWTLDKLQEKLGKSFNLVAEYQKCLQTKQHAIYIDLVLGSKYFEIRVSPILINPQTLDLIGVLIILDDVTEEKVLMRSRDEFFSIASHELRTPLTAIRGNTSLIEQYFGDKIKDPEVKEMLGDIHESSVRLIGIVNDFLNMGRLEMGKMEYKKESIDVVLVCQKVIDELANEAKKKDLKLSFQEVGNSSKTAVADKDKLKEVAINLISNAIKYSDNGSVEVKVESQDNSVKVSVSDTGRGIGPEGQNLLFRKFQQAGSSLLTRDTTKGTGLGLYISKLMVEGMSGKIWLEKSEIGRGSVFSFTLPKGRSIIEN